MDMIPMITIGCRDMISIIIVVVKIRRRDIIHKIVCIVIEMMKIFVERLNLFANVVPFFGGVVDAFLISTLVVFLTGGVPFFETVANTFCVTTLSIYQTNDNHLNHDRDNASSHIR
jgi:hypothetical protein